MARKKKQPSCPETPAWLITFSDLTTLLLTFFILLLSMSSMDTTVLAKVNVFMNNLSVLTYQGAGRIPQHIRLLIELLEDPFAVMEKENRIKDLLFPDDLIPPEISRSTLMENLSILQRPEGVAMVLTEQLLFAPGSAELTPTARKLLLRVGEVLSFATSDVYISGHTDSAPGGRMDNFTLSTERALSVLGVFVEHGLPQQRFSVAGYGPEMPMGSNDNEAGRAKNRRVEILLKTRNPIAGY